MKTIKYDNIKVTCPVCKKVIFQEADDNINIEVDMCPCPHTKLWYNECENEILHCHPSLKKALAKEAKIEELKVNGYDEKAVFNKIAKANKLTVHKYDGGNLACGVNAIDLIAFSK